MNLIPKRRFAFPAISIALLFVGCANNPEPRKQAPIRQTPTPTYTPSASQRTVIRSVIVNRFKGFNRGNIYELANGQMWEQIEPWIWYWIWNQPQAIIVTESSISRLKVEQIDHPVLVSQIHPEFEGRITNDFNGFEYGAVFELDNGQTWEQTDTKIEIHVGVSPKAVIWMSGGAYRMKVGNVSGAVTVKIVK